MYHKISEFISDWKFEADATKKVLSNLTDKSLTRKLHDKVRTPGILAWHIVTSIPEMMNRTGLTFESVKHDSPVPKKAAEIVSAYQTASENMVKQIKEKWTDDTLLKEDDMYGEKWAKGRTLGVLVTHQIHHRGQLAVVMRLAGLKIPGVYGPSNEEWTAMGMEAQE